MSREEDLIRSTTRAIASAVREVPPLRLEPAAEELETKAVAPRRPHGARPHRARPRSARPRSARPYSGTPRRWWSWSAPLTAAAVVIALAVSLVLVKDMPNGGALRKTPATATPSGPAGTPRYYAALKATLLSNHDQLKGIIRYDVVVGDAVTAKTLATFTPPARTTFQSVTAAADDLTFVVFAVTSSTGSFQPRMKKGVPVANGVATLTASWYLLRLAPGTAHPASLSRLPIKPWSWSDASSYANPAPGQIIATALSGSGQELAVADIPDIPAAKKQTPDWHEVKVFSVASGALLHDWIEDNPATRLANVLGDTLATVPLGTPALTWIDNDRALAVAMSYDKSGTVTGTVRRLDVAAGRDSGNLMTDSTVIWSGTLAWNQSKGCFQVEDWPPLVGADGTTISCITWVMPSASPGHVDFDTYPLVAGRQPTLVYRGTILPENQTGGLDAGVLWASPSGDTLIVDWGGPGLKAANGSHFGVVSHGKFTPLPLQANRAALLGADIAF